MPGRQEVSGRLKNFFLFWLPWYLYSAAIFVASAIPHPEAVLHITIKDFLLHPLEFLALCLLTLRAFRQSGLSFISARVVFMSVLFCLVYAASDEFHQFFVPGRTADFFDWIYDSLGILTGVLIYYKAYGKQTVSVPA